MTFVQALLSFLEPWPTVGEKDLPYVRGIAEDDYPATNFENEDYQIQFQDARMMKENFSLDQHGFTWSHSTVLNTCVLEAIRSREKESVVKLYYPLVEQLLKDTLGASRVIIFDHTYRKRDPALDMKENPNGKEQPATVVSQYFFSFESLAKTKLGPLRSVCETDSFSSRIFLIPLDLISVRESVWRDTRVKTLRGFWRGDAS